MLFRLLKITSKKVFRDPKVRNLLEVKKKDKGWENLQTLVTIDFI